MGYLNYRIAFLKFGQGMKSLRYNRSITTTVASLAYLLVATGLPAFLHLSADHSESGSRCGLGESSEHCLASTDAIAGDDHHSTPDEQPKPAPSDCEICWQLASITADDPAGLQVTISAPALAGDDIEPTIQAARQAQLTSAAPRAPPTV